MKIKNIALISELDAEFAAGLTVLSGETGAGKSIIVDSINFILGAKADKSMLKSGADKASVNAVFFVGGRVSEIAEGMGVECGGELVISRTLNTEGKSECRVNGSPVTVSMLKTLTAAMVDMHGQHEHQSLLNPAGHLGILDKLYRAELSAVLDKVAEGYAGYREIVRKLGRMGGSGADRARRLDILRFQIDEIESANISENEYENLIKTRQKLINFERINHAYGTAAEHVGHGVNGLAEAVSALNSAAKFDADADALAERLKSCLLEAEDAASEIAASLNSFSFDEREADRVEARLDKYKELFRKYGGSVAEVMGFLARTQAEYDELLGSDEAVAKLNVEKAAAVKTLTQSSLELSRLRRAKAKVFEERITNEMNSLGMKNASFSVNFRGVDDVFGDGVTDAANNIEDKFSATGVDSAEFYFSANAGVAEKPLSKIVSGGEMSRLMLALKVLTADVDGIDTMIFDEIDAGISGVIGRTVAEKLAAVSRRHQVISVSHLAQIVAMADYNYLVKKSADQSVTQTSLVPLDADGKADEAARLVGEGMSKLSRSHAEELIAWCENFKKTLSS
ncbi:MAG: DNA repair protein RecN [Firmicutes bacterium]|nr:DNA repair protein RecN [Bacillota bacterium]